MNNEDYKTCLRCKEVLPAHLFRLVKSRNTWHLNSYCKPCKVGIDNEWRILNAERTSDYYHKYTTNERNFIRSRISSKFKPSAVSQEVRQLTFLKKNKYAQKIWEPELTKEEMWAELFIHIQKMKDMFPDSNGRLCKICFKPWTYIRSKPKVGAHGSRKVTGGKAYRKKHSSNFSIDRFDTSQTYKKGNIIFVCGKCNHAKGSSEAWMWNRCLEIKRELEEEHKHLEIPKIWRDDETE